MTTIGKILVILNLVFALVAGGFFVIDFATRTNWKTYSEKLEIQLEIAKTNTGISGRTQQELNTQVKSAEADRDDLKRKLVDQEKVAKVQLDSQKSMTDEAIEKTKDADVNLVKAIVEKDRLKEEVKGLAATVQNRDLFIQTLQDSAKKYRTDAIAQEEIANKMQGRNVDLLAQIQDLLRKGALRDAGVGTESGFRKDPNAPNPPSANIKGKIVRINADDRNLVQISVGSDQGLNKNHTLEVYRLTPRPEYLGMILIVEADQRKAIGRLVRTAISGNRTLQEGDIVATSLKTP